MEYFLSEVTNFGPMVITTGQKYIFEPIMKDGKTRYREVFTGFIADIKAQYFDLPYVINIQSLKEVVCDIDDVIPRLGLLLTLNQINFKKVNHLEETKDEFKVFFSKKSIDKEGSVKN